MYVDMFFLWMDDMSTWTCVDKCRVLSTHVVMSTWIPPTPYTNLLKHSQIVDPRSAPPHLRVFYLLINLLNNLLEIEVFINTLKHSRNVCSAGSLHLQLHLYINFKGNLSRMSTCRHVGIIEANSTVCLTCRLHLYEKVQHVDLTCLKQSDMSTPKNMSDPAPWLKSPERHWK